MGFLRWRAFVASADECWAIRFFGSEDEGRDEQSDLAARGQALIEWQQGCSCNTSIVTYSTVWMCHVVGASFTWLVKLYSHTPQTPKAQACGLGSGLPEPVAGP